MKITSNKIEKFGSYSNRSEIKWKTKICERRVDTNLCAFNSKRFKSGSDGLT